MNCEHFLTVHFMPDGPNSTLLVDFNFVWDSKLRKKSHEITVISAPLSSLIWTPLLPVAALLFTESVAVHCVMQFLQTSFTSSISPQFLLGQTPVPVPGCEFQKLWQAHTQKTLFEWELTRHFVLGNCWRPFVGNSLFPLWLSFNYTVR